MVEEKLVLVSTILYTVLIGGEFLFSHFKEKKYYTLKDTATNVYLMLLNMGFDVILRVAVFGILSFFYQYRFFEISNVYLYWFLLFIAEDIAFYWLHRLDHTSRFFWAVHVTHHSSSFFNLTTGFRSSVFQPFYRFVFFIPLALVGFNPLDIFLMYAITQIYGIIVHTQLVDKMGFLEYFLVTPSHHRVHHASNIPYLDKNLGMCLIIWDKIWGTFQAEIPDEEIEYGLVGKEIKRDPVNIVFHEWKEIANDWKRDLPFRIRLQYMFRPPGWSHDGSRQTSEELQRTYWKEKVK